jgi:hypothetical protein
MLLRWLVRVALALAAVLGVVRGARAMGLDELLRGGKRAAGDVKRSADEALRGGGDAPPALSAQLVPIARARLHVTEGALTAAGASRLRVEEAKMRAVADGPTPSIAELRFTYLGPTREEAALRSGELRRQIGLKLRARDGCNLVYAMWRLAPEPGVVVQLKYNPGKTTSAECGNEGYRTVKPRRASPVPAMEIGSSHALRAELRGRELRVLADGQLAWEGTLPEEALSFDGPVGLRSDNGRFELELLADHR